MKVQFFDKTKILRFAGEEKYWVKVQLTDGTLRWSCCRKDTSAIIKSDRDTCFHADGTLCRTPNTAEALFPVPPDFLTDLLPLRAKLQYATGHAPAPPVRF